CVVLLAMRYMPGLITFVFRIAFIAVLGTDKSKIIRKQSKASKHGHENQKSAKRSQRFKAEARKIKPQSNPVKDGQ
ncbi:hypothetical protein Tco_0249956, partial [Tanacetum coccineum]